MNWQTIICQIFGHEDAVGFWEAHCRYCGQRSPDWVQAQTGAGRVNSAMQKFMDGMARLAEQTIPVVRTINEAFKLLSSPYVLTDRGPVLPFGSANPWEELK